jgi:hypothetical protein
MSSLVEPIAACHRACPSVGWTACALIAAVVMGGCTEHMCDDRVDATTKYRVTFVELYDASTHFRSTSPPVSSEPCGDMSGVVAGSVVEVKGTGALTGVGCLSVVADFASLPDPVKVLGLPTTPPGQSSRQNGGPGFLVAAASVTAPGGNGDLLLALLAGPNGADIFATPQPGQFPPAIAVVSLYSADAPFTRCLDQYVVQLERE